MDILKIISFSLINHNFHLPNFLSFLYSFLISYVIVDVWFHLVVQTNVVIVSPIQQKKISFNLIVKRENIKTNKAKW